MRAHEMHRTGWGTGWGTVMAAELILKNAKIVTPGETILGSVVIRDQRIADIGSGSSSECRAGIDLEGDYLIPGLTELHTDNLERHVMPRPGVLWPVMSALVAHDAQIAAAGITTVLDSLCIGMGGEGARSCAVVAKTISLLEEGRRSVSFRTEHLLHLRVELSNARTVEEFSLFANDPMLRLVSLMDHTPGQRQWRDLSKYIEFNRREFKKSSEQIEEQLKVQVEQQAEYSEVNRRAVIRLLQGRDVQLASHDDTIESHVEQAHKEGIRIAEFPTTLEAARAARGRGMAIVAGAPNVVLGRSHSGNVSVEDLAKNEVLDALSSDYVPSSLIEGAFLLSRRLDLPLHRAVRMVTLTPSRLIGLEDRGSLEVGQRADLVRVRVVDGLPIPREVWRAGQRIV